MLCNTILLLTKRKAGSGDEIMNVFLERLDNQQIDVSFSCVWPIIDHEFRHNVVKVAAD